MRDLKEVIDISEIWEKKEAKNAMWLFVDKGKICRNEICSK